MYTRTGRLAEARARLEQARAIFEGAGDRKDLTRALGELARVLAGLAAERA